MTHPISADRRLGRRRALPRFGALLASSALALAVLVPAARADGLQNAGQWTRRSDVAPVIHRGQTTLVAAAHQAALHPRRAAVALPRPSIGFKSGLTRSQPNQMIRLSGSPRIPNAAPLTVPGSFVGLTETDDGGGVEPPDPWIAVNGTYVVQVVNSLVRISSRTGTTIQTLPDWALFALPSDEFPADPHIIWDAFHSRWVGLEMSFNGAMTQNYLNLAISATADPLGAWDTYAIDRAGNLPDYPGLASSTDRIVLTADDFAGGASFTGPEIDIIAWSQILAGGTVTPVRFTKLATFAHVRPAQVLSPSAAVHAIYEDVIGGHVRYLRVDGPATAPVLANDTDVSVSAGIAALTVPPDPHNADGTTISTAADERPTDAVWRNGRLWFVATYNAGGVAGARATMLQTTSTFPTVGTDLLIAAGGGWELYMPGVGVTGDDTAVFAMTASGTGLRNPTTIATTWTAADGLYGFLPFLDTSDAPYGGDRWGDYVGVAADPASAGSAWIADEAAAADGTWRTTVMRFAVPTISAPPASTVVVPATLPTVTGTTPRPTVPVRISWAGNTAQSAALYEVSQNIDGTGFETIASSTTATSIVRALAITPFGSIGHTYQFRARVNNGFGGVSAWQVGAVFTPTLYQQTSGTAYSSGWSSQSSSSFSGGSVKYASTSGRSTTFTATNALSIAIVTTKAKTRGSFKVYVDGVLKGTIKTYSTTTKYRQTVFQYAWSTPGTHKIKIVVSGTSGHPRVDVDAFVVLR